MEIENLTTKEEVVEKKRESKLNSLRRDKNWQMIIEDMLSIIEREEILFTKEGIKSYFEKLQNNIVQRINKNEKELFGKKPQEVEIK